MAGCASFQADHPAPVALHSSDDRGQQLFDQAVKLQRRYGKDPKAPKEPLQSILTELSLYHDQEEASYLSDGPNPSKRSGPIDVAPWAQEQLALRSMQRKDFAEAASEFIDLGERFEGRMIVEPSDESQAEREKAGPAALLGEIKAMVEMAREAPGSDLASGLKPKIEMLQEKYGSDVAPCDPSCDSYSRKALLELWEALALDKADFKTWLKASADFAKNERSTDFSVQIWLALGEGCSKLGKSEAAADCYAQGQKLRADAKDFYQKETFAPKEILFSNLLKS
jgi:hypothetical protein